MVGHELTRFVDLSPALAEELTCSICHQIYDNAVDTPCRHTYCYECLNKWVTSDGPSSRECPECRQPIGGYPYGPTPPIGSPYGRSSLTNRHPVYPWPSAAMVTQSSAAYEPYYPYGVGSGRYPTGQVSSHYEWPPTSGQPSTSAPVQSDSGNTLTIGNDVRVERNRKVAGIVAKLRVRCDYHRNGCPEVTTMDGLAGHLIACQHRLCPTCELDGQSSEHDCAGNMRRALAAMRRQLSEYESRHKLLETESNALAKAAIELQLAHRKSDELCRQVLEAHERLTRLISNDRPV